MHRLRHGDHGPAVAEIRGTLTKLGYLHHGTSGIRRESADGAHWVAPDAIFDHQLDSAVRAFQQQRGIIADGHITDGTLRALREASYTLGARVLSLQPPGHFFVGDDVAEQSDRYLREYYRYAGEHAGTIAEQAVRSRTQIRSMVERFAEVGMNELVFTPTVPRLDQVDALADALS